MADHRSSHNGVCYFTRNGKVGRCFETGRGPIQLILAAIRCSSRRKAISADRGEGLPQAEGCRRSRLACGRTDQQWRREPCRALWPGDRCSTPSDCLRSARALEDGPTAAFSLGKPFSTVR